MALIKLSEHSSRDVISSASICVIGAGIAGLLVAMRLAAAGKRVSVIESGEEAADPDLQRLNELEDVAGRYTGAVTGRVRALGGTSTKWSGGMLPLTSHELGPRPYISVPAWPIASDELATYNSEINRLFQLDGSSFDGGQPHSTVAVPEFVSPGPDLTCRWIKLIRQKNRNVAVLFRDEIKTRRNLQVWLGATVVGFGLDGANGRLSSIEARDRGGRRLKVCADTFIFAAGTIETTRLLLLLNRSSSERAFERCLVLGRYFQDHLEVNVGRLHPVNKRVTSLIFGTHFLPRMRRRLRLELTPQAQRANRVANAFAHVVPHIWEHRSIKFLQEFTHGVQQGRFRCSWTEAASLIQDAGELARLSYWRVVDRRLYFLERVPLDLRLAVEQLPFWENRICLSEQVDEFGVQKSKLLWQPTLADERTFRVCLDKIASYWARSGLETFCPIEWTPAAKDPSSLLIENARDTFHPSGTTRMGTDPVHSVVGPDLRCHAVPNIYVVSASVFPSSGAANPTLTLAQLALRCAGMRDGSNQTSRSPATAPHSCAAETR